MTSKIERDEWSFSLYEDIDMMFIQIVLKDEDIMLKLEHMLLLGFAYNSQTKHVNWMKPGVYNAQNGTYQIEYSVLSLWQRIWLVRIWPGVLGETRGARSID
jgi:hypothetical protein